MGKGDRKTTRGKTYRGSYGKTRQHRAKSAPADKSASKTPRKTSLRRRSV